MVTKFNKTSRRLAVGVAAVSLASLAACGSGSGSTSNPSPGAAPDIKVMSFGTTSSASGANAPEGDVAIKAAFQAINDAGGINGQKVDVVTCNDQADPNQSAACARQAVSDKVAAVVVHYTSVDDDAVAILQAAKIPFIEADSLGAATAANPIAFLVTSDGLGTSMMHGLALQKLGCQTHAVLANNVPAGIAAGKLVGAQIAAAGGKAIQLVVQPSTVDFAPVVASAFSQGAECFDLVLTLSQSEQLVNAVRSSAHPDALIGAVTDGFPASSIKALGSKADGLILTSAYTSETPPEVVKDMKALDPSAPVTTFAISGWTSAEVFIKAAQRIQGPIDAASVLNSLNTGGPISGISTIPSFDPSTPNTATAFAREVATKGYAYKVVNGELTRLTSLGTLDVQSGYDAISAAS